MKKVIYTCITGNYDSLKQPLAVREDWDYVCFSDCLPEGKNGVWEVRTIPYEGLYKSRYPKLLPHKVLSNYDLSLYIDANLQISSDELYEIIEGYADKLICQVPHLAKTDLYDELADCYRAGKISFFKAKKLHSRLVREGFPHNYGLFENNIILRQHNNPEVIAIDEDWWAMLPSGAGRDQLSAMYVYWKHDYKPQLLFGEGINVRNAECISYFPHESAYQGRKTPKLIKNILLKFL